MISRKKMILLILPIMILGIAEVYCQVRIVNKKINKIKKEQYEIGFQNGSECSQKFGYDICIEMLQRTN